MTHEPACIVLGATGRLGRSLLPRLQARGCHVIGVSRARPSETAERGSGWVCADLTESSRWPQVHGLLRQLLGHQEEVVIIDLVLDRVSVTSMRQSITAATRFVVRTRQLLTDEGLAVRVLAASTTAVLAPRGLRTPYSAAKRRQAFAYARLDAIDLVLLPQLGDVEPITNSPGDAGSSVSGSCSYEAAAGALHEISLEPAQRSLWILGADVPHQSASPAPADIPGAIRSAVAARTAGRDSPAAHRQASHQRLALLPASVRVRVDHHGAPAQLLRPFERRLRMPRARTVIAGNKQPAPDPSEVNRAHRP